MTTDPKRSAIDAQGNHVPEDATEDQLAQARKHKFDDDAGSAIIQYAEYVSNNDDASSITLSHTPEKSTDPKYAKELLEAVHRGSIPLVEIMLKHVDADVRDLRSGRTALSFAAEAGNYDLAKLLLNHGASVNCRQYSVSAHMIPSGRFPLHWATIGNNSTVVVKLLLDHGANPNARNTAGRTVLQEACKENVIEAVRVLLQNGADVNGRSSNHVCFIFLFILIFGGNPPCFPRYLTVLTNRVKSRAGLLSTKPFETNQPSCFRSCWSITPC